MAQKKKTLEEILVALHADRTASKIALTNAQIAFLVKVIKAAQ